MVKEMTPEMAGEAKVLLDYHQQHKTGADQTNWLKRHLHICDRVANQIIEEIKLNG